MLSIAWFIIQCWVRRYQNRQQILPTCNNDRWIIFLSDMMWFNLHIENSLETNYNNRSLKKIHGICFNLQFSFHLGSIYATCNKFMRMNIVNYLATDRQRTFVAIGFGLKFSDWKRCKLEKMKMKFNKSEFLDLNFSTIALIFQLIESELHASQIGESLCVMKIEHSSRLYWL